MKGCCTFLEHCYTQLNVNRSTLAGCNTVQCFTPRRHKGRETLCGVHDQFWRLVLPLLTTGIWKGRSQCFFAVQSLRVRLCVSPLLVLISIAFCPIVQSHKFYKEQVKREVAFAVQGPWLTFWSPKWCSAPALSLTQECRKDPLRTTYTTVVVRTWLASDLCVTGRYSCPPQDTP